MVNYCLPIINGDIKQIQNIIQEQQDNYAYFEIWLDYLESDVVAAISELNVAYFPKIVFVLRRQNLEIPKLNFSIHEKILKTISGKACLLDLDIEQQAELYKLIKKQDLKLNLISSFHDYKETPQTQILENIYENMKKAHPSIFKFSCYCIAPSDAVRLLGLGLRLKDEGKKYIVLGMGEHSLVTRTFGTLWGNEMVFTPLSAETASAPGQLTREALAHILMHLS